MLLKGLPEVHQVVLAQPPSHGSEDGKSPPMWRGSGVQAPKTKSRECFGDVCEGERRKAERIVGDHITKYTLVFFSKEWTPSTVRAKRLPPAIMEADDHRV